MKKFVAVFPLFICAILLSVFGQNSFSQNPTVISDSLVIMQRLHAKEELIVDQDALFKGEMHVIGESRFETDVRFDEGVKVEGTAKLDGDVKMENLTTVSGITSESEFLIILPNGQVKKGSISALIETMYNPPASLDYCGANGGIPQWWSAVGKIFTACPDVKVGIRTDDPLHALHVVGVNYAQKFLAGNVGATSAALFNGYSQNESQTLINLGIKIGGLSEEVRFTITNKGEIKSTNIGTGTSLTINNGKGHAIVVHSYSGDKILQLEDNGLLRSRRIKVDTDSWADYVFKPGYQLKTLSQTETFIKENGHLPGVPGQKEITENGLDLGEMQRIQMEKIEELYLHVIQLEKTVNELSKENQQLKKELSESNK